VLFVFVCICADFTVEYQGSDDGPRKRVKLDNDNDFKNNNNNSNNNNNAANNIKRRKKEKLDKHSGQTVVLVDQSLHERVNAMQEALEDQRSTLDSILSAMLRTGSGGAREVGKVKQVESAAAEAIAQLSLPPTPISMSIPDLGLFMNSTSESGPAGLALQFRSIMQRVGGLGLADRTSFWESVVRGVGESMVKDIIQSLSDAENSKASQLSNSWSVLRSN
jgi:hypothetical protein